MSAMTITDTSARPDPAPLSTGWIVDTSTFGARLALVRNRMQWNMKEAARECGQPAATWRLWELEGVRADDPPIAASKIIAARTGCDFRWLVHGPDRGDGKLPLSITPGPQTPAHDPFAARVVTVVGGAPSALRSVRAVRVHPKRPAEV